MTEKTIQLKLPKLLDETFTYLVFNMIYRIYTHFFILLNLTDCQTV